jgi:diguanylate cyclase (GGDEF)-like protein
MDLFVPNEEINLLERRVNALQGSARLVALVTLAWHVRLRDCERALELADEAQSLLDSFDITHLQQRQLLARLLLLRSEVKLMFADLPAAQALAQDAEVVFSEVNDFLGMGDVSWLKTSIAGDLGDEESCEVHLREALSHYQAGGDTTRADAVQIRMLDNIAFHDAPAAFVGLQRDFPQDVAFAPALKPWLAAARANVAGLTNDPSTSIQFDLAAYHAALDTGQIRLALVSLSNAVESFTVLGDLDAALEWMEKGLALARTTGWPSSLGICLQQMGDVMRLVGRHAEAKAFLQEASTVMSPLKVSRNYELVIFNLGRLALDTGEFDKALDWFEQFDQGIQTLQEPDLLIKSCCGQASAMLGLGRQHEANAKADKALMLAREHAHAEGQIQALCILAKLHPDQALGQSSQLMTGGSSSGYLNQAMAVTETIKGYTASSDLLFQMASAYAARGDFKAAYDKVMAANDARQKSHSQEAQQRVLAMQVRQQIERVKAEAEYHKQLVATLKETASTLETLGIIGREITASLDAHAVFESLHRHAHELLDATFFAVYLLDETNTALSTEFGVEAGKPLPKRRLEVTHPTSMFALAVRERREVMIEHETDFTDPNLIPGTLPCRSQLFFPLMAGERLLGAMSVQSPKVHAYAEREHAIFRTLCAYGGIALDNARAYSIAHGAQQRADQAVKELRETQARLVQQNKLLESLSVTDQLTGLYNRLQLDRTLESERMRHLRYGVPVSLLLIDLDFFKSVNDNFGHLVGDQVLVGVTRLLQSHVREMDEIGRWGGEEFLVICKETTLEGAVFLAEKLRLAVSSYTFDLVGRCSISVGVAGFNNDEQVAHVIARADAALYRAKSGGRNRVEFDASRSNNFSKQ